MWVNKKIVFLLLSLALVAGYFWDNRIAANLYEYTFENLFIWQIIFIIIGLIALFTAVLNLFSSYGDHTRNRWVTKTESLGSENFIDSLTHLAVSPQGLGEKVTILNNGDEFLPAFLKDILSAKESINLSMYIWEDGKMSDQILASLREKLSKGVEVRILLDGFGSIWAPRKKLNALKMSGARIEWFRTADFGKLTRFHRRNHRRALVIDGLVGYIGGMAVSDRWLGSARNKNEWRDMMFRVTGKMAQNLQGAFAQLWASTNGEILMGDKFYPPVPPPTKEAYRYVSLASAPSSETQALPKIFWLSAALAQEKLYITSPYFVPDRHIRKALIDRAHAGADVRILLPNHYIDGKPIRAASHFFYERYLKAGIKIYEYSAARLHVKSLVADGIWSIIGSANMDRRSIELNEENIFGIQNQEFAADLEKIFMQNIKLSKQITLELWKKRPLLSRVWEFICVHFVKQY